MNLGFLKGLYAGCPADTAYILLNFGRFLGMKVGIDRVADRLGPPSDYGFRQGIKWFLLKNAGRLWVPVHGVQFFDAYI